MLRRLVTVLSATAAAVAMAAAPASADPRPPYTSTSITSYGLTDGVFLNGLEIHATCHADVTGVVAATVITECRLVRGDGWWTPNHPEALPGNAVESTFVEGIDTLDFNLCWKGYTVPLASPDQQYAFEGCTDSLLPTGGGFGEAINTY